MYEIFELMNNNRLLWGVTTLLLNLGSRYVVADLGKFHETILSNEYVKKIIIFCMFFVGIRDVVTSFLLTILYIVLIDGIFHEKRKFCILPKEVKEKSSKYELSEEQYIQAKKIVIEYEQRIKHDTTLVPSPHNVAYETYAKNIKLLNHIE